MRLEKYFDNFDIYDSEKFIMAVVTCWEQGQKLVNIYDQFSHKLTTQKPGVGKHFIKKIITEYAYHNVGTPISERREYWLKNNLWLFLEELRIKLFADNGPIQLVDYRVHSTKNYNPDDQWFRHYTQKNILAYAAQKSMANKRGVDWQFHSFEEWLLWWLKTDQFENRGVHDHEYQMCRHNDTGAYSWDNVYCATGKQNRDDFHNNEISKEKHRQSIIAGKSAQKDK
jgi:hypothetical protein